jgi:hypothetical protein
MNVQAANIVRCSISLTKRKIYKLKPQGAIISCPLNCQFFFLFGAGDGIQGLVNTGQVF